MSIHTNLLPAVRLALWSTLVTGLMYTLLVSAVGHGIAPWHAQGSPIEFADGRKGSYFVGVDWSNPAYFNSRPSASGYSAIPSYATNLAPTSEKYRDSVRARAATLGLSLGLEPRSVAADLVTSSASGLDPHVSPMAARQQVPRILKARSLPASAAHIVFAIIDENTSVAPNRFAGDSAVHVASMNASLDCRLP